MDEKNKCVEFWQVETRNMETLKKKTSCKYVNFYILGLDTNPLNAKSHSLPAQYPSCFFFLLLAAWAPGVRVPFAKV
jgi:hypothetical protein